MNNFKSHTIKLDSHVHHYDCWKTSLNQLLTTAHTNLSLNTQADASHYTLPTICLLDTKKEAISITQKLNNLNCLKENKWEIENIELEPYSFWVKKNEKIMLIITGTQINTYEGLEVLVIGNKGDVADGMPIKMILGQQREGLLNVIPWAAGKWLSKRGLLLSQLLKTMNEHQFVLGDNAGRPWPWNNIKQFKYANSHRVPILAGSDPLPLDKHYLKSGTYGNFIDTELNMEKPWASIIQAIHNQNHLKEFGHLTSVSSFILNQFKLRL